MNPDQFINLHNHSNYSIIDGYSSLDAIVSRVHELGQKAVGLTEHGNLFSAYKFYNKCKKFGIKPILGEEAYIVESLADKTYGHITLFAENNTGWKNLIKLSSLGYLKGFYHKPRITFDWLIEHQEGLLITTGCLGSWSSKYYQEFGSEHPRVRQLADLFKDRFYVEIHTNSIVAQKKVNTFHAELASKYNKKCFAACDSHYPSMKDYDAHDIITALREGKNLDDKARKLKHEYNDYYLHSAQEAYDKLKNEEWILNTLEIAERCNVEIASKNMMPKIYENPKLASEVLETHIKNKLTDRITSTTFNPQYDNRLSYELETIYKLGFSDYFLIIEDIIQFCKKNNIRVGPGRGSGAGSLVCYVLGITDVDPIKYGLFFERFINPERISPPDLDLDFDSDRREEVVKYCIEKYGRNKVANIITFGSMQSKTAIKDVARTYGVDFGASNLYTKLFDENESATIEQAINKSGAFSERYKHDELFKKIIDTARKFEGMIRQPGTHAAGIVISPNILTEDVPIYLNKKDNAILTQWGMEDLEELGFLKMDFLGLKTLNVIEDTLKLVENESHIEKEMNKLDDPEVYKMLQKGHTSGVFQFEGAGITGIIKQISPENIEDLSAINALYRPGAMSGDMLNQYVTNRKSKKIKAIHPSLSSILKDTYGTLLYQENIMQMSIELAGFTGAEADTLRKAVAKKKMELLEPLKQKFIDGCRDGKYKIPSDEAAELYKLIEDGGYGFNRSHSLAYSIIAYQTAYLKKYYPTEFMCSLINSVIDNTDKIEEYIKECKRLKIKIKSPDINKCSSKFSIKDGHIYYGLNAIKGVNFNSLEKDRNYNGEFKNLETFLKRIAKISKINSKILVSLINCGATDCIHKNRKESVNAIETILHKLKEGNRPPTPNQTSIFDMDELVEIPTIPIMEDYSESERLLLEQETIGFYLSKHPLEKYTDKYDPDNLGIITDIKKILDRKQREMAFFGLDMLNGKKEGTVFASVFENVDKTLKRGDVVYLEYGEKANDSGENHMIITRIRKI